MRPARSGPAAGGGLRRRCVPLALVCAGLLALYLFHSRGSSLWPGGGAAPSGPGCDGDASLDATRPPPPPRVLPLPLLAERGATAEIFRGAPIPLDGLRLGKTFREPSYAFFTFAPEVDGHVSASMLGSGGVYDAHLHHSFDAWLAAHGGSCKARLAGPPARARKQA